MFHLKIAYVTDINVIGEGVQNIANDLLAMNYSLKHLRGQEENSKAAYILGNSSTKNGKFQNNYVYTVLRHR